jgi:adenine-specific DNA-methyltransferase
VTAFSEPLRAARTNRTAAVDIDDSTTDRTAALLSGLSRWWSLRARAAGLSGRWLDVSWAVGTEVPAAVGRSNRSAVLDGMSAAEIGEAYTSTLVATERARHGRHYTPATLAENLWAMSKRALGWKRPQALTGLVRDRACGAGALLLPPLREHLAAAARVDAQVALAGLPNYVSGIDNDPHAVWLANVLLASEMLPILSRTERARRRPLPALVMLGDGLAKLDAQSLVEIMNPPYGRVRLSTTERERFAATLYGHANLYGLFMAAGVDDLEPRGVLAALVPTSFLAGRYFENLRAMLARAAPLREVEFAVDRSESFEGVLQETCLATFSPKLSRRTTVSVASRSITPVAKVATPRTRRPWLLPRCPADAPVAAAAAGMDLTLAAAGYRVSTGPLVWNRRKADLSAEETRNSVPVLWAADIDGSVIHRDQHRDHQRYLSLRGNDERIMVLTEPAVLVQRTTAPEQSRRLVAAPLTSEKLADWGGRIVVENHVNVVRPLSSSLFDSLLDVWNLWRLLATDIADRVLRCMSGSVAVSAYELEALPLPAAELVKSWSTLSDADFDHAVAAAYRPGP